MPSTFLDTPFGGSANAKFEMGGIANLFLIPHAKVISYTSVLDSFGSPKSLTDINLAGTSKFVEIGFVEGSASYTDQYKPSNTKRYMEHGLNFTVDESGADAVEKSHEIYLTRKHIALVKRKNNKWYLLGMSDGMMDTDGSANSGAKREDDSAHTFTLLGGNLGHAPEVNMISVDLEALLTRLS